MNKIKLVLRASILLLGSTQTTTVFASLIRIDIAGETVAQVERNGIVFESGVNPLIPVGTGFSGYFVYDTSTPPTNGTCSPGSCGYEPDVVTDAFFTLGPLTFEQADIFSEATVVADSDLDEYSWDWFSSQQNTVDGYFIRVMSVILEDTTGAAVSNTNLPTEIEIKDFDIRWARFGMNLPMTNFSRDRTLWAEIDDFSVSTVSTPTTSWLFGIGMIGLVGFTRRSRVA